TKYKLRDYVSNSNGNLYVGASIDISSNGVLVGASNQFFSGGNYGVVLKKTSSPEWTQISNSTLPNARVSGLASAPGNPNKVYAALGKTGVYVSTDGG